ncbi:hypothetical protein WJ47_09140 [Burkholderia ubonensis]|uniref:Rap1a immunity protein domain-containing protein n=1 Tax=Burkholderia ubonensis TaxID=101571 RepID=A0AB73G1P2_9BURK|nr:Rap1a/Tai family immunity protein [Burkholderia ubonensis]KVG72914.1 hypothetical protein WJ34_00590 [Burkholderia ubonensis]KVH20920.1 hypothetical protein WJ37_16685 [Burkholderia ubonensis]KVH50405.1 hypothetical protein WJ38_10895 [Burkholderia ubonensis]KVH85719.1 hypothetical protein WJ43_09890 [Burkholderia ubonensis]KVK73822.1 hypothetical protein WJ44_18945 [Burkholderia ubonensis]
MSVFSIRNKFVFVLLSTTVGIANGTAVPRVDGVRLLDSMSRADNSPYANVERHVMTGYLAGVADSTEGRDWCGTGRVKSGEIDSEVLGELRKLPRDALKVGAAGLIVNVLRQKYPCR